jgi:hypothetical protein
MTRQAMSQLLHPDEDAAPSGLTADELAAAFVALADGFALQRLADPDAIPDELVLRAAQLLFGAMGTGERNVDQLRSSHS